MAYTTVVDDALRQGDIIKNVPYIKPVSPHALAVRPLPQKPKEPLSIVIETAYTSAVVLSYCCELSETNSPGKISSIILAPLREIIEVINNTQLDALKQGNKLAADTKTFAKLFYMEPGANVIESVADFSHIYTLSRGYLQTLKQNKIAQMDDTTRSLLSEKISYYFLRPLESSTVAS